jgi:hypothetical protein
MSYRLLIYSAFLLLFPGLSFAQNGGLPPDAPDHSSPKIKHVTGTIPYNESFEQRCARGQNVCNPKEVLFDVPIGQSGKFSFQLLEACSSVSIEIQIVDDKDKVVRVPPA